MIPRFPALPDMSQFHLYKKSTGLYIGAHVVDVVTAVSVCGMIHVLKSGQVPIRRPDPIPDEEPSRYNERVKESIVEAIHEAWSTFRIKDKRVVTAVPGRELVIRFFKMLKVPSEELNEALRFEAKKHLPFKIEDLEMDFTVIPDDDTENMSVVTAAALKQAVKKQIDLVEQAGLEVEMLDPMPIAVLRALLQSKQLESKGIYAILSGGVEVANVTIVQDGVPYLCRDISLAVDTEAVYDTVHSELVLTLDYFKRQFPPHKVDSVILSGEEGVKPWAEKLKKDFSIPVTVGDVGAGSGGSQSLLSSFSVAFGLALRSIKPGLLGLNLMPEIQRTREGIRVKTKLILQEAVAGILIIFLTHLVTATQVKRAEAPVLALRQSVSNYEGGPLTLAQLGQVRDDTQRRREVLETYIGQEMNLAKKFSVLAQLLPEGFWLERVSYSKTGGLNTGRRSRNPVHNNSQPAGLVVEGAVYSEPPEAGLEWIRAWVDTLKGNADFVQGFSEPKLEQAYRALLEEVPISRFKISCSREQ